MPLMPADVPPRLERPALIERLKYADLVIPALVPGLPVAIVSPQTYRIARSLRFSSADSTSLTRSALGANGNRKVATFSAWVKRATTGSGLQRLLDAPDVKNNAFCFVDGASFAGGAGTPPADTLLFGYNTTVSNTYVWTNARWRDPTAWMHVLIGIDTTQVTAANRVKIYVNNVQQTLSGNYLAQNADLDWFSTASGMTIGANTNLLMAEVHLVEGVQLDPTSFGATDALTGTWTPKAYVGPHGTNGSYLDFSDNSNTTSSTLGKDRSGNSNDWTPNNFSVSAGAGNDSLVDTPTNYGTDTGAGGEVRGNYCTMHPLTASAIGNVAFSNGNLTLTKSAASDTPFIYGTMEMPVGSGVWGWEILMSALTASGNYYGCFGVLDEKFGVVNNGVLFWSSNDGALAGKTRKYTGGSTSEAALGSSPAAGQYISVIYDSNNNTVKFYLNGTLQGSAVTGIAALTMFPAIATTGTSNSSTFHVNFGQRPWQYPAVMAANSAKALCVQNLPDPIYKKPRQHFDIVLDTGANIKSAVEAVFSGSDFLEWIKDRANSNNHQLIDTVRGTSAVLQSNSTGAETTYSAPSGNSVGWVWKKGPLLDIVSYTGNATNRTIAHALGVVPALMIFKNRTDGGGQPWNSYHKDVGATKRLRLNATDAAATSSSEFNDTAPTSSVFSVGTSAATNGSGADMIAFLFAEIPGLSKFGIYTGNGSADGPFIWCGFKPRWIMVKRTDTTGDWLQYDSVRELYNPRSTLIFPNSSSAEFQNANYPIDLVASGFKLRAGGASSAAYNASGATHIFAAFADVPAKYARAA